MKHIRFKLLLIFLLAGIQVSFAQSGSNTCKPWTYWWWMGSAVNQHGIKKQLQEFSAAGLGGVHIIPIYGVKGYENQFIPFLSEKWTEMVQFTIRQAGELGMGVDLTLGTGWPYGGSWIDGSAAAKKMKMAEYRYPQTDHLIIYTDSVINNNGFIDLSGIVATNGKSELLNLSPQIQDKIISRDVERSDWKVTFTGTAYTGQKVKRAAPGGEGMVMDYFDERAVLKYLHHFDSVFSSTSYPVRPRAFYHDSYEAYQANWSFRFIERFRDLRGYDLTDMLPALLDSLNPDRPLVIHDFRETLSDLLYSEFATPWTGWCRNNGNLTRYQAHGSPGNLLDLYALSDIPETESFGCSGFAIPKLNCDPGFEEQRFGRPSPLMFKFASSPAHVLNKPLVSSETGTWLGNHFNVSLRQIKPQIDELLISGINHIFYHGITYSPENENYPGWLFYASTNFGQSSHFWDELPLLNAYVHDCQAILQNSQPDNDILLYFPIDDLWTKYPGDLLLLLDVHKYPSWFGKTNFGKTARLLWDNGYAFDYISDRQIAGLAVGPDGRLAAGAGPAYSLMVVPAMEYISANTVRKLDSLAQKGAKIIFIDKIPDYQAGYRAKKKPDPVFPELKKRLTAKSVISDNILNDLKLQDIRQEGIKLKGLDFIRKRTENGTVYFVTNLSDRFYEDSISLAVKSDYIELFYPHDGRKGFIKSDDRFMLKLPPGRSCFITSLKTKPQSVPWKNFREGDTLYLDNEWSVSFITGNNQDIKSIYNIDTLSSWTGWGDENLKSFCGKAKYVSGFRVKDPTGSERFRLVFGDIHETAQITINGQSCGTIWSLPYSIEIPPGIIRSNNTIEITVQNLSANLIRKIDSEGVPWKKFYDINFVDIRYQPFDASGWDPVPSGLEGKVMLIREE